MTTYGTDLRTGTSPKGNTATLPRTNGSLNRTAKTFPGGKSEIKPFSQATNKSPSITPKSPSSDRIAKIVGKVHYRAIGIGKKTLGKISPGIGINSKGDIDIGLRAGGAGISLSTKGEISLGIGIGQVTFDPKNLNVGKVEIGLGAASSEATQDGCTITVTDRVLGKIVNQYTRQADNCREPEPTPSPTPVPTPSPDPNTPPPTPQPSTTRTVHTNYVEGIWYKFVWNRFNREGYDPWEDNYNLPFIIVEGGGIEETITISTIDIGIFGPADETHFEFDGIQYLGRGCMAVRKTTNIWLLDDEGKRKNRHWSDWGLLNAAPYNPPGAKIPKDYIKPDNWILVPNPKNANSATETLPTRIMPEENCDCELLEDIYDMLGGDDFKDDGLEIPNHLFIPGGTGETKALTYNALLNLMFRTLDHRTVGEVEVSIKDNNIMKEGDQPLTMKLVNATAATGKILELSQKQDSDLTAVLNLLMRLSWISVQILKVVNIGSEATKAVVSFFAIPVKEKVINVDIPVDPSLGGKVGFDPKKPTEDQLIKILDLDDPQKTLSIFDKFMNNSKIPVKVKQFIGDKSGGNYWWLMDKNKK